jgi:hypothetical protein
MPKAFNNDIGSSFKHGRYKTHLVQQVYHHFWLTRILAHYIHYISMLLGNEAPIPKNMWDFEPFALVLQDHPSSELVLKKPHINKSRDDLPTWYVSKLDTPNPLKDKVGHHFPI